MEISERVVFLSVYDMRLRKYIARRKSMWWVGIGGEENLLDVKKN